MIYCETNYEQGVRVEVRNDKSRGMLVIEVTDVDTGKWIGLQYFDISAERECVARAKRICEGKPFPGEMSPMFV